MESIIKPNEPQNQLEVVRPNQILILGGHVPLACFPLIPRLNDYVHVYSVVRAIVKPAERMRFQAPF